MEPDVIAALQYISRGELPEVMRLRVEMLLEEGENDLALNLCLWCSEDTALAHDPFLRGAELLLLFNEGHIRYFYERVGLSTHRAS